MLTARSHPSKSDQRPKGLRYRKFEKEDFDAIVTGELTHFALWMEGQLEELITNFFCQDGKGTEFRRILLRRDGLNFQDKIEIVRAMLPLFGNQEAADEIKVTLQKVEEFKANRNTTAHGVDVTDKYDPDLGLEIEVVGRSGKQKFITITPESHNEMMDGAEELLKELQTLKERLSA